MAANRFDAIVVGAGHNGLVAAAYLAKAGMRTVVLERRDRVGGPLVTEELGRGVRGPVAVSTVGRLHPSVVRDLWLREHGFHPAAPAVRAVALSKDGGPVTFWADPGRTADELRSRSPRDAACFVPFDAKVRSVASFLARVQATTPPDLTSPSLADALSGLKLGRALRGLGGERQVRETLRILPMASADLAQEAFDDPTVQGYVASRGVRLMAMGPWSAGSGMNLLWDAAGGGGAAGETTYARGGPGALADALLGGARAAGAEVRCSTDVVAIRSEHGLVRGVALGSGEELDAPVVVSNADPKRTLLGLVDPVDLGPTMAWRVENLRTSGVVGAVTFVLDGLPAFAGIEDPDRLRGRIVLAPSIDRVERAFDASKYGRISEEPFLEATIPTLADPTLAPEGTHVMTVHVQYAPRELRDTDWATQGGSLSARSLEALEHHAPGINEHVVTARTLTPEDLEADFGLTGGHPMHGEHALDQFFAWRPLLGHARYRIGEVRGLYLCGAGAHPGGGVTGGPGANAARAVLADRKSGRDR